MMDNFGGLVDRIFDHLENDDVEKAAMTCLRLARLSQDYLMPVHKIFLRP